MDLYTHGTIVGLNFAPMVFPRKRFKQ